jgi:hypothetical protein
LVEYIKALKDMPPDPLPPIPLTWPAQ